MDECDFLDVDGSSDAASNSPNDGADAEDSVGATEEEEEAGSLFDSFLFLEAGDFSFSVARSEVNAVASFRFDNVEDAILPGPKTFTFSFATTAPGTTSEGESTEDAASAFFTIDAEAAR